MKYDDVRWHERDDRPQEKAIHIGFYMQWLIERRLVSTFIIEEAGPESINQVTSGTLTGYDFLMQFSAGALVDDLLNGDGKAFTNAYYKRLASVDLEEAFPEQMKTVTLLLMPYTQSNYRRFADIIDRRLDEWKHGGLRYPPKVTFLQGMRNLIFGPPARGPKA